MFSKRFENLIEAGKMWEAINWDARDCTYTLNFFSVYFYTQLEAKYDSSLNHISGFLL